MIPEQFEDIRSFTTEEIPAAMQLLVDDALIEKIIILVFGENHVNEAKTILRNIKNATELQKKIMTQCKRWIVSNSMKSVETQGLDTIQNGKPYLFTGNHRDITLDAFMLQISMIESGLDSCNIAFGSNLILNKTIEIFSKANKMFKVERSQNIRELAINSQHLSDYIRYLIKDGQTVWIAQRNGRTKDGFDKTEPGVLKMLAMSSDKDFIENLAELNITPIAISYEYESCDFLKTQELYVSRYQKYVKAPNEDFNSILCGITQPKGHVAMVVAPSITLEELEKCSLFSKTERFNCLAKIIDRRIISNYKLFKNNYIAYDILQGSGMFSANYTNQEKQDFIGYMKNGLDRIEGDMDELTSIFLGIYANPVRNMLNI